MISISAAPITTPNAVPEPPTRVGAADDHRRDDPSSIRFAHARRDVFRASRPAECRRCQPSARRADKRLTLLILRTGTPVRIAQPVHFLQWQTRANVPQRLQRNAKPRGKRQRRPRTIARFGMSMCDRSHIAAPPVKSPVPPFGPDPQASCASSHRRAQ